MKSIKDIENIWSKLASQGITVSVCYGQCGKNRILYSIDALNNATLETFEKPYGANSLQHAMEIAEIECEQKGWYVP